MSSSAQTCCGQPVRPLLFLSPVAAAEAEEVEEEEVDEEDEEEELVFGISICNEAKHESSGDCTRSTREADGKVDGGDLNCVTSDRVSASEKNQNLTVVVCFVVFF